MVISRSQTLFILIALLLSFILIRGLVERPNYTDAYYHLNAATRLAKGEGLVDDYLWTYIGAPDSLPAPSHLYWMPLTSILAAIGMKIANEPGDYASAQLLFIPMLALTGLLAYRLAFMLGGGNRHAWIAGILTIAGGFFAARWGTLDTFTPYAFIGSMALLLIGLGLSAEKYQNRYWILAGVFAGLGHLTRADGLLLLLTAWAAIFLPTDFLPTKSSSKNLLKQRFLCFGLITIAYLITMSPWFMRNLNEVGTILPTGGTQSIWFTEYNDLFSYPQDASTTQFFAGGLDRLIQSRWTAFVNNLGTFVAVEGLIIIAPLMLIGLWRRRKNVLLRGVWIFAIGIHVAMTFVFPFPGFRGGLFHAVAALMPFWMVLGIFGLDDVIDWIAKHRSTWNPHVAKPVFSVMLLAIGLILSYVYAMQGLSRVSSFPRLYATIINTIPQGSRVMINDPSQLYYFTGYGGVVLPNESIEIVPVIARQYDVKYLMVENVKNGKILAAANIFQFDVDNPPPFLKPIPISSPKDARLYEIITE